MAAQPNPALLLAQQPIPIHTCPVQVWDRTACMTGYRRLPEVMFDCGLVAPFVDGTSDSFVELLDLAGVLFYVAIKKNAQDLWIPDLPNRKPPRRDEIRYRRHLFRPHFGGPTPRADDIPEPDNVDLPEAGSYSDMPEAGADRFLAKRHWPKLVSFGGYSDPANGVPALQFTALELVFVHFERPFVPPPINVLYDRLVDRATREQRDHMTAEGPGMERRPRACRDLTICEAHACIEPSRRAREELRFRLPVSFGGI